MLITESNKNKTAWIYIIVGICAAINLATFIQTMQYGNNSIIITAYLLISLFLVTIHLKIKNIPLIAVNIALSTLVYIHHQQKIIKSLIDSIGGLP